MAGQGLDPLLPLGSLPLGGTRGFVPFAPFVVTPI